MRPSRRFIGVDPGAGGGMAVIRAWGEVEVAVKMPETERDIWNFFHEHTTDSRAVIEFVRASPQMGVSSAFKFGCGYGGLRAFMIAAGIPFEEVQPRKWRPVMGCKSLGKEAFGERDVTASKNITKARAQELFPDPAIKITHALADALLLAEYARRLEMRA